MDRHETAASTGSMELMKSSRPFFLIVITLCLVLLALVVFWLAAMPHQLLSSLKRNLESESGIVLEATTPQLSFDNGLVLALENVSLGNQSLNSLSAQSMKVKARFATLFGGGFSADDIAFHKAVVTVDVSSQSEFPKLTTNRVVFTESILRIRDEQRLGVISVGDVNGVIELPPNGAAKANITFLLSDRLTTFNAEAESAERLFNDGSPTDITLSTTKAILGFSGQAKLAKGVTLSGQTNLEGDDAGELARWLGMPLETLEGIGRVSLLSGVSTQGLTAKLDKFSASYGSEKMTGNVTVAVGPDRLSLSGDVDVTRITLFSATNVLSQPWSEKPFSVVDVTAVNFDLVLKIKQLVMRGLDFGAVTANIKSADKSMSITLPEQPLTGGTGDASFTLTQDKGALMVEANVNGKAFDAKTAFGGAFGLQALEGTVDVTAKLNLNGNSLAALVSSASGTAKLSAKALTVSGGDVASRFSTVGEGWQTPESTEIDANFSAQLSEGVVVFDTFSIKLGNTSLKPRGEVDVLRQAFALQLTPKLILQGPWNNPSTVAGSLERTSTAATPPAN